VRRLVGLRAARAKSADALGLAEYSAGRYGLAALSAAALLALPLAAMVVPAFPHRAGGASR
jgi:hypothetical protein